MAMVVHIQLTFISLFNLSIMKKFINLLTITVFIASITFTGCVRETFKDPNLNNCDSPSLTKTKEVAAIYLNPAIASNATAAYTADDIIEGYVVSSDQSGNFYTTLIIQPTDGSKGFTVSINEGYLSQKGFKPGTKVFLKLKGLSYSNPTGFARGLIFGVAPTDIYAVDRLLPTEYGKFLIASCDAVSEDAIVKNVPISSVQNDIYLNTLIEIDDVQFKTDCARYSKPDFDTSLKITNGTSTLDVRTSKYASFAGNYVPSGRGKIRGVLTKYNSGFQLVLRSERDVKFTGPRVSSISLPKVGSSLAYTGTLNEDFQSYATTTTGALLPKYINDAPIGFKYWDIASFGTTKYLQSSAYNNGCTKSYFIVPVDLTAAKKLSFQSKDGYSDGQPLKVYYSTNYVPGGNVNQATLIDISSNFAIAMGSTTGYAANFTDSGIYSIPDSLQGNGYFIFEYDGTTGITTTLQLDNIIIANN